MLRTPGEHMKDFIGAEVHVRKEHLWSSVQETTKMTFILTQPLRGAVPHDVNPLENMTMCLRLGTELDSLSPREHEPFNCFNKSKINKHRSRCHLSKFSCKVKNRVEVGILNIGPSMTEDKITKNEDKFLKLRIN